MTTPLNERASTGLPSETTLTAIKPQHLNRCQGRFERRRRESNPRPRQGGSGGKPISPRRSCLRNASKSRAGSARSPLRSVEGPFDELDRVVDELVLLREDPERLRGHE